MGRCLLLMLLLATAAVAQEVQVGDEMIRYRMVDGRQVVSQGDLAKVMPDLEPGDEYYDLIDVVEKHPDLRGARRDGVLTRVRYYGAGQRAMYGSDTPEHKPQPVKRTYRRYRKVTKGDPRTPSWRYEPYFANRSKFKPSRGSSLGRVTDVHGRVISSSSSDKARGIYASRTEYNMNTFKPGRVTTLGKDYQDVSGYTKSDGTRVSGYRRSQAGANDDGPGRYKDGVYVVEKPSFKPQIVEETDEYFVEEVIVEETGLPDRLYYVPLEL